MTDTDASIPWYSGITATQWSVLAIASAGWVFDVYEGQLFTVFATPVFHELLHGDADAMAWHSSVAFALFLVGGAVGGLGFGMLADRIGRVRVMSLTILVYSIFSALTFFARSAWEIEVLRFLVALGTGGEWAVAAALVSETFPKRARAFASGVFHASSVLGAALAALTGRFLNAQESWRWGFLIGLAPALMVLWIRASLKEPERWQRAHEEAGPKSGSLTELLGDPRWRTRALLGLALAAVGLGTYWGTFAKGMDLMRLVLGPTVSREDQQAAASMVYLLMNITGALLGLLAFAPIASRWGRRPAFAVYHLGAFVTVPLAFLWANDPTQTLILLSVMGFFVVGMHAGYAIYLPELFPTRLRATGSSFCFNVGRLLGAVILLVQGNLIGRLGLRNAVSAMAALFLLGLVILIFTPETRESELIA